MLTIQPASGEDLAFIVHANHAMALETEGRELHLPTLNAGVGAALADPRRGRYFVAWENGVAVGTLLLTYEWSDWRNGEFWWLQSVYVHPDYRRRGVFRRLMAHVVDLARATPGIVGLRLYMANDNRNALRTYEQCGFQHDHYVVLVVVNLCFTQ